MGKFDELPSIIAQKTMDGMLAVPLYTDLVGFAQDGEISDPEWTLILDRYTKPLDREDKAELLAAFLKNRSNRQKPTELGGGVTIETVTVTAGTSTYVGEHKDSDIAKDLSDSYDKHYSRKSLLELRHAIDNDYVVTRDEVSDPTLQRDLTLRGYGPLLDLSPYRAKFLANQLVSGRLAEPDKKLAEDYVDKAVADLLGGRRTDDKKFATRALFIEEYDKREWETRVLAKLLPLMDPSLLTSLTEGDAKPLIDFAKSYQNGLFLLGYFVTNDVNGNAVPLTARLEIFNFLKTQEVDFGNGAKPVLEFFGLKALFFNKLCPEEIRLQAFDEMNLQGKTPEGIKNVSGLFHGFNEKTYQALPPKLNARLLDLCDDAENSVILFDLEQLDENARYFEGKPFTHFFSHAKKVLSYLDGLATATEPELAPQAKRAQDIIARFKKEHADIDKMIPLYEKHDYNNERIWNR